MLSFILENSNAMLFKKILLTKFVIMKQSFGGGGGELF